jgi:hypothetical protein
MAQPEEPGDRTIGAPIRIIETINKVVRTAQQMLPEIGCEPTPEELSEKLAMPLDKVHRVLAIAKRLIRLEPPTPYPTHPGLPQRFPPAELREAPPGLLGHVRSWGVEWHSAKTGGWHVTAAWHKHANGYGLPG